MVKWIIPLGILIACEMAADILAKSWSLSRNTMLGAGALLAYLLGNTFWLFALKNGSGLWRGAIIFSLVSAVLAVLIGIFLYREPVTRMQLAGIVLGFVALTLIFWE